VEKLLQMAKKVCDEAEIYSIEGRDNSVFFKNDGLDDMDSKFQSGMSLRIIKGGKLGFAYTRNLTSRQELVQNALDSLEGGVEADYDFPLTKDLPGLDTCDSSLESLSGKTLVEECARVCDLLKSKTDGEISRMGTFTRVENLRIMNSQGTDTSTKSTEYGVFGNITYPGYGFGIWRVFESKGFERMPDSMINEMIELYKSSSIVVEPEGGKMQVMFAPNSMVTLNWRILSGTSSKSVYEKTSPVADKIGKRIFDEKITIYDDPLNDKYPKARSFDDEGVACKPFTIVEKGNLKGFYCDLNYANKLNAQPTGHGYRITRWGGDPITLKPVPALTHMIIKPGNKSFAQMVRSIDKGIIIEGALGYHSGNIPNGDYSIGVCPGLYVEKGEILGRVKDAMIAGNIYETLRDVVAIGDTLHPSDDGAWVPAVLCNSVRVATKK
jgi:PmbA protein